MTSELPDKSDAISSTRILYVHSGAENRPLVEQILKFDFAFAHCHYQQCVEHALQTEPEIVILEIDNNVDRCLQNAARIRSGLPANRTGMIFIAADGDNALRFRCYEAGGDDFIAKPFDLHELLTRVAVLLRSIEAEKTIEANKREAFKLVNASLSSLGEQGVVLNFHQYSLSEQSYPDLAKRVVDALDALQLCGSFAIWPDAETTYYSNTGTIQPIEQKLLESSRTSGNKQINTLGQRCLVRGDLASILIRNLPVDQQKRERYQNVLAMLIDGLDLLTGQIDLRFRLTRSEMQLTQTVLLTRQSLVKLKSGAAASRQRIKVATEGLIANMESAVLRLGLTEEQENELVSLVEQTEQQIDAEIGESLKQEEELDRILAQSAQSRWKDSY